jgi:hypothetical protein
MSLKIKKTLPQFIKNQIHPKLYWLVGSYMFYVLCFFIMSVKISNDTFMPQIIWEIKTTNYLSNKDKAFCYWMLSEVARRPKLNFQRLPWLLGPWFAVLGI